MKTYLPIIYHLMIPPSQTPQTLTNNTILLNHKNNNKSRMLPAIPNNKIQPYSSAILIKQSHLDRNNKILRNNNNKARQNSIQHKSSTNMEMLLKRNTTLNNNVSNYMYNKRVLDFNSEILYNKSSGKVLKNNQGTRM